MKRLTMETMMSDFSCAQYPVSNCSAHKNEDDPDVTSAILVVDHDQTDILIKRVFFGWKTARGHFVQRFGPFYSQLSAESFAQARWPKAYKAWLKKYPMRVAALAPNNGEDDE